MSGALSVIAQSPVMRRRAPDKPERDTEDARSLHKRLVDNFEEAERSSTDSRALSERDRDYVDGKQWTSDEQKALHERGQPDISTNYCRRKVSLLCGLERKARTDPKAYPRTPEEEDRADAATQSLRYMSDDNEFPLIRSKVFEDILVEGYGGVEVSLQDDGRGGADIKYARVPWDRLFHDPHSNAEDFSDARYLGIVIWMDRDQLEEMYPDAGDVIEDTFADTNYGGYGDKPSDVAWHDSKRRRTRVVQEHWIEDGEWWCATFTKADFVDQPYRSKFKNRHGKSACALVLQSAYIDRENNRYGMVRDLIPLQDEINKRRSKALHLLSVNRVIAQQGAVEDVDKARREAAKPDGYIEVLGDLRFEILTGGEMAKGQFELLQHATQEMQLSGPNAAMSGSDPRELSGIAFKQQQTAGAVQNEPLADSLRWWSRRVHEMGWMAARESWTAGKWVRVTDDLQETRWVGINQPQRLMDALAEMPEQQRAMVMQRMQLQPNDPRLQQVVGVQNDITDLDVDITVEEGMDVPMLEAETFQSLIQLAGMQPGLIPLDILISSSPLRNKADILQRLKDQMEAQQQEKARQAPLVERHAVATVAKIEGEAAAAAALAQERKVASARGIHDIHSEFTAPPYGQPHMAADAPSAPGTAEPDMPPEMQALHDAALLRKQHAEASLTEVKAAHEKHKIAQTIAATHQVHHEMHHPPKQGKQ